MEKQWYMIMTTGRLEHKAKESLEKIIKQTKKEADFGQIFIPEVEEDVVVKGKKEKKKISLYPGYILVQMNLSNDSAFVVRKANHVKGFLGGNKPQPISQAEYQKIISKMEAADTRLAAVKFTEGEEVTILDGPFKDFKGNIDSLKPDKLKAVVMVTVFGRDTPVELGFEQIAKSV